MDGTESISIRARTYIVHADLYRSCVMCVSHNYIRDNSNSNNGTRFVPAHCSRGVSVLDGDVVPTRVKSNTIIINGRREPSVV